MSQNGTYYATQERRLYFEWPIPIFTFFPLKLKIEYKALTINGLKYTGIYHGNVSRQHGSDLSRKNAHQITVFHNALQIKVY